MGDLDGRIAIVSGAARGSGRAIALRLASEGARIIAGDLLVDELASLRDELSDDALVVGELDVRDRSSWDRLVVAGTEAFGRVDVLVNNAGILRAGLLEDETADSFEELWRVNCLGALNGMQAVLDPMRTVGGGAIVNTLSAAGIEGFARHGAYGSSKWALRGLTKVAAIELAAHRIRVNAVVPGPIATPMILPGAANDDRVRATLSRTPLGRIGEPDDIAEATLFLVSDRASFVTGAELAVDGGMLVANGLVPLA